MMGYQPQGHDSELPNVLPFGGSNVIPLKPVGPPNINAATRVRYPGTDSTGASSGYATGFLRRSVPPPRAPAWMDVNVGEQSITGLEVFVLWMLWGFLGGGFVGFLIWLFSIAP